MKSEIKIFLLSGFVLFLCFNCMAVPGMAPEQSGGEKPTFEPSADGSDVSMNIFALLMQNVNSNPQGVCTEETCVVVMNPCAGTDSDDDCLAADVDVETEDDADEGDEDDDEPCAEDEEGC